MKALIEDISKILNPIYFDRMIAREHLKQFTIIILIIPFFLLVLWLIGLLIDLGLNHYDRNLSACDFLRDNIVWDTLENYINANCHSDSSFSHRLYMLFVGIIGALFLNGILISTFVSWVEKRSERWKMGDLHYDKMHWFQKSYVLNNHVVIIGGNEMVPDLIRQLLEQKSESPEYVLLMTNRDVPSLRNKLSSVLGEEYEKRVVIYYGDRTIENDLLHLQIELAKNIYVIGEQLDIDQNGSHHDVKNMECVRLLSMILRNIHQMSEDKQAIVSPKLCRVMFEYQSTFSVFQFTDVNSEISEFLDFRPFNYYETWAQKVFVNRELVPTSKSEYLPLEGTMGITVDDNDCVHLIVVGMSRMGIAMAVEAAHIAHYPNFISKRKRTRITFIDSNAQREMNFFQGHYKELFAVSRWRYMKARKFELNYEGRMLFDNETWHDPLNDIESQSPYKSHLESNSNSYDLGDDFIDVEWQFIEGDLEMPGIQQYISNEAKRNDSRLTIAICIPKDNASLAASLYLPNNVYEENSCVQQVLVYQPYGDAMQKSFKNDDEEQHKSYKLFAKLRAFGMMNKCYDVEAQQSIENMLEETNQAYNSKAGKQIPGRNKIRKKFGLSEAFKGKPVVAKQWSSYYSASHMWTKLRSVCYDGTSEELKDHDVSLLAQVEHIRWNIEQLLMGYEPLNADKFIDLKTKFEEGKKIKTPSDEILSLIGKDEREKIPEEEFLEVVNWLKGWKAFDDTKEQLKANMKHADICAYDILETIDKDAMSYDVAMVKVLPKIYKILGTSDKSND